MRSVEREVSPPVPKDISKNKSADKTVEHNRGRSPSADRSRSRNREGPRSAISVRGMDILCGTARAVISTQWDQTACPLRSATCPKSSRSLTTARSGTAFKLSQGRAGGPRHDPPLRQPSPEWGSTDVEGDLVKKEEKQKQTIATKEAKPTHPQAAMQTPGSDIRTMDKQGDLETTPLMRQTNISTVG